MGLALTCYFAYRSLRALQGYSYQETPIQLASPLRSGCYAVVHGGSRTIINYHVVNTAQRYANDIVKLNRWGCRARGVYPKRLDAYCIFGENIYSPCDGVITNVIDDCPDLTPGETDHTHPAGNHVIIEYEGRKILLAHMKQESVLVREAEQVHRGQCIGKVGNSGNTSEPHLHIHIEYGGKPDRFGDGVGAPILFEEKRFLKRNDLLVIRDKI
jgi:hypothetical protein